MNYFLTVNIFLKHLTKYFIQMIHKSNEKKKAKSFVMKFHFNCRSKFKDTFKNYSDIYNL